MSIPRLVVPVSCCDFALCKICSLSFRGTVIVKGYYVFVIRLLCEYIYLSMIIFNDN